MLHSPMMTAGLFPLQDQPLAFAPIVDGGAEIGMAGLHAAFRICRFRAGP